MPFEESVARVAAGASVSMSELLACTNGENDKCAVAAVMFGVLPQHRSKPKVMTALHQTTYRTKSPLEKPHKTSFRECRGSLHHHDLNESRKASHAPTPQPRQNT